MRLSRIGIAVLYSATLAVGCQRAATPADQPNEGPLERPNVLWLTCEDISPYAFGCYGNADVQTPNIDGLAARGVRFTRASAVSPYCSPARSTIISGQYAHRYGNDWHRGGRPVPMERYFFPRLLREEAGYFTSNIGKEDYNVLEGPWAEFAPRVWDHRRAGATYNSPDRPAGAPFFSVFNNMSTHMSRLCSVDTVGRSPRRIDPRSLRVPPYLPDDPTLRDDYGWHLEKAESVDRWVGQFLDDLEARGLADDTIIFFYSDHGGSLPRGKAYPTTTGLEVPLIVYAPPRYQHLLPSPPGSADDRLVDFTDLAPTVLSLAGLTPPAYMDGRNFLDGRQTPRKPLQYGVRCNSAHVYSPSRTVTDGRFLLVRHFVGYLPHGLRQEFQWRMPGQLAYDSLSLAGELSETTDDYYQPRPGLQLFDLAADPWQRFDIADRPEHAAVLRKLSDSLRQFSLRTQDMGLLPNFRRAELAREYGSVYAAAQDGFDYAAVIEAAHAASSATAADLPRLATLVRATDPALRYWGAVGLANLVTDRQLTSVPAELLPALEDPYPQVAAVLATAVALGERPEPGLQALRKLIDAGELTAMTGAEVLGTRALPLRQALIAQMNRATAVEPKFYATSALVSQRALPLSALYRERRDLLHREWEELQLAGAPLP